MWKDPTGGNNARGMRKASAAACRGAEPGRSR